MGVRVRYVRTELSEGIVEVIGNVDYFVVLDDNTVELRKRTPNNKYKVTGYIHPARWESIVVTDDALK